MAYEVEFTDEFGDWWDGGHPIRVFYAFDPRRVAILLIGGDKTGDDRFYERMVPVADRLYDEHLQEIEPDTG